MDIYIPSAKESRRFYDPAQFPAMSLKPKIEALWSEVVLGHFLKSRLLIWSLNDYSRLNFVLDRLYVSISSFLCFGNAKVEIQ